MLPWFFYVCMCICIIALFLLKRSWGYVYELWEVFLCYGWRRCLSRCHWPQFVATDRRWCNCSVWLLTSLPWLSLVLRLPLVNCLICNYYCCTQQFIALWKIVFTPFYASFSSLFYLYIYNYLHMCIYYMRTACFSQQFYKFCFFCLRSWERNANCSECGCIFFWLFLLINYTLLLSLPIYSQYQNIGGWLALNRAWQLPMKNFYRRKWFFLCVFYTVLIAFVYVV